MKITMEHIVSQFIIPLWNKQEIDLIDKYLSKYVDIQTTFFSGVGRDILKNKAQKMFSAFSDLQVKVTDIYYQNDEVIYKWQAQGVHINPFMKIKPSRLKVCFSGVGTTTLDNGVITHFTTFSNLPMVLANQCTTPKFEPLKCSYSIDYEAIIQKIEYSTGKKLTKREVQCLTHWLRGSSIKETARALGNLSTRTIQTFRENIKRKLKTESFSQLFHLIQKMELMPVFLNGQDPMISLGC